MFHIAALVFGFAIDRILGDPRWLPHPIRAIGTLIAVCEQLLRRMFPDTKTGLRAAGVVLVVLVAGISTAVAALLLWASYSVSAWLGLAVETILCYFMLAARSLEDESMKVYHALEDEGLEAGRAAVAMIVGRDTNELDEEGVTKATVETIAENASDGVVAPLLFMAVGGAAAGVFYKAVNTMDSMVGYKNDAYQYFGTAAALLDDVLNWIPARVSGMLMCAVAGLAGLDSAGAWRIFKRDRRNHASPNSAHTEAACAGALGVQLAGPARYFGVLKDKPTIGDATRPIELEDIVRANTLLLHTAVAALAFSCVLGCAVLFAISAL